MIAVHYVSSIDSYHALPFTYKFVFVTWQKDSDALNVVEHARMSSDKALIKAIMTESSVQLQIEDPDDLTLENIGKAVAKTGI
ncbi:coactosin protein-like [Tropilaelaps mercedesae]|uniref:Coactosin protein-like n=1 Tax=Tropilaelaps mercedesae TaxID=418985 RepID=A0A1V9XW37_9ACAR|nr:coactosin protein-like [Tropilaelaps mercedesae]